MARRAIYISEHDMQRLQDLMVQALTSVTSQTDRQYLAQLGEELQRARVVPPQKVSHDVVTMNSRVRLKDLDTDEEMVVTLVFPDDDRPVEGRLNVLVPVGTSILGERVGRTITWPVPAGTRRLRIAEILYQPEAAGRYDE